MRIECLCYQEQNLDKSSASKIESYKDNSDDDDDDEEEEDDDSDDDDDVAVIKKANKKKKSLTKLVAVSLRSLAKNDVYVYNYSFL
jgi:hypothetical protein